MNAFFPRGKTLAGKKNTPPPRPGQAPNRALGRSRAPPKVDPKMSPDCFKRSGFLIILIILGISLLPKNPLD